MISFAEMNELWQLTALGSDTALGNPTGVVFLDSPPAHEGLAETATMLGYPDTIFMWPEKDPQEWTARFFSPAEEMAFCVQALVAANRVLRHKFPALADRNVIFNTPSRRVMVGLLPAAPPSVEWVQLPYEEVRVISENLSLSSVPSLWLTGDFPEITIDVGRRRIYRRLPDKETLEHVTVEPEAVMSYCRSTGLNGICLFALTGRSSIALRVFTTSLDGREDAATGGAVFGLLTYLERQEPSLDALRISWTINQGSGPLRRRGMMFLRYVEPGMIAVGGLARFIVKGRLLGDCTESGGAW